MKITASIVALLCCSTLLLSQLDNSDWGEMSTPCIPDALLYPGVAAVTCGVTSNVPVDERYVMAFMALNNGIAGGRTEITDMDSVLHHTDWLISNIGNLFGLAINESTATTYVTASSNFGSAYGYINQSPAVLNYGIIGSPASEVEAAGTIYEIDPYTGAASVFAVLPQQSTSLEHWDCERDRQSRTRDNTGVGLGNIVYDETNDQFFVSNVEDGRIYRLDASGAILDSYDPFDLDTGVAGIDDITEIPYGLAIEAGSGRLFFGTVDPSTAGSSGSQAQPGAPEIYSIDLNGTGGFIGTVDNSSNDPSATWDNFQGTDTFHTAVPTSEPGGAFSYTNHSSYFISDLAFDPDGNLLVGVRVGCYGSWHSSYNHWGEMDLITIGASGLYDTTPMEYDISVTGDAGSDDNYGGVSVYDLRNDACDVHYLNTSADILRESGPHGVLIFDQNSMSAPLSPIGVFSYGLVDVISGNNQDPKGVGADVEIYGGCQSCDLTGQLVVCQNEIATYNFISPCPGGTYEWQVDSDAMVVNSTPTSVTIQAGQNDYKVSLISGQVRQDCSINISVVSSLNGTTSATPPICYEGADGTATVSVMGGAMPYSYSWDDPSNQSTETAINLSPGTYMVSITDSDGCTAIVSAIVPPSNSGVSCLPISTTKN